MFVESILNHATSWTGFLFYIINFETIEPNFSLN